MSEQRDYPWIDQIRARGWSDAFSTALDVLEPLGPLGAQLLLIAQPAAHLIGGWGDAFGALAEALEAPDGIEKLRKALDEDQEERNER